MNLCRILFYINIAFGIEASLPIAHSIGIKWLARLAFQAKQAAILMCQLNTPNALCTPVRL